MRWSLGKSVICRWANHICHVGISGASAARCRDQCALRVPQFPGDCEVQNRRQRIVQSQNVLDRKWITSNAFVCPRSQATPVTLAFCFRPYLLHGGFNNRQQRSNNDTSGVPPGQVNAENRTGPLAYSLGLDSHTSTHLFCYDRGLEHEWERTLRHRDPIRQFAA